VAIISGENGGISVRRQAYREKKKIISIKTSRRQWRRKRKWRRSGVAA
jgi:hypothetical protein